MNKFWTYHDVNVGLLRDDPDSGFDIGPSILFTTKEEAIAGILTWLNEVDEDTNFVETDLVWKDVRTSLKSIPLNSNDMEEFHFYVEEFDFTVVLYTLSTN